MTILSLRNRAGRHVSRTLTAAFVAVMVAAVGACAGDEEKREFVERPVEPLYNDAMNALDAGSYKDAAALFDEVERQHPYSPWATRAQMMAAYAYYEANQYDDAIGALDRFMQLHPANPEVPYAQYLKSLCYYERITDPARDQEMTEAALKNFRELVARYPESEYARDANLKIDLALDHLAGKEMVIGRYYLRQGHNLAAINRFKTVVDRYQTTTHVPEALHRLVEAYTSVGMVAEARKAASVLGYNFPGSEWYSDTYVLVGTDDQLAKGDDTLASVEDPATGTEELAPVKEESAWYELW